MLDWLKQNKSGLFVISIAAVALFVMFQMQGCSIYDTIKMPVPTKVRQVTGAAPTIPISEYPEVRQQYLENSAKGVESLDANYSEAAFWADIAEWGINLGVEKGQDAAENAGIPGGALITTLIAGVGGLMLRKPGDNKKLKENELRATLAEQAKAEAERLLKEKIDSFNAGMKTAAAAPASGGGTNN